MKRIILLLLLACCLSGCGASAPKTQAAAPTETTSVPQAETAEATIQETSNMIRLTVGENTILAELADNKTAGELAALLQNGPITMSASNYGGFEKVCALGRRLTSNDVQTTTRAGDIMLYSSSQIVIFYGTNSWAYTRLGWVTDEDIPRLEEILSGGETEVIIELI